jgi:hypothetical protein
MSGGSPKVKNGSNENDLVYELRDGWSKRITQRQSGNSAGLLDVYLTPPAKYPHKRLRSTNELVAFLIKHPECPFDPRDRLKSSFSAEIFYDKFSHNFPPKTTLSLNRVTITNLKLTKCSFCP